MDDELRKKAVGRMAEEKEGNHHTSVLERKGGMGMVPYVQAMLLARYLRGDLDSYPVFLWK